MCMASDAAELVKQEQEDEVVEVMTVKDEGLGPNRHSPPKPTFSLYI